MTAEVRQLHLRQEALALDAVHDLQVFGAPSTGPLQPQLELLRLRAEPEHHQGREGQRGVSIQV